MPLLQSNPPKGLPLTYCNIGDLWQRMLHNGIINMSIIFPLELYTSADVQNRKNQISDFNKVMNELIYKIPIIFILILKN